MPPPVIIGTRTTSGDACGIHKKMPSYWNIFFWVCLVLIVLLHRSIMTTLSGLVRIIFLFIRLIILRSMQTCTWYYLGQSGIPVRERRFDGCAAWASRLITRKHYLEEGKKKKWETKQKQQRKTYVSLCHLFGHLIWQCAAFIPVINATHIKRVT